MQRIEESDAFVGAILLGSLVHGRGDALSDIDLVAHYGSRSTARA